jgi:hypothetical protein
LRDRHGIFVVLPRRRPTNGSLQARSQQPTVGPDLERFLRENSIQRQQGDRVYNVRPR